MSIKNFLCYVIVLLDTIQKLDQMLQEIRKLQEVYYSIIHHAKNCKSKAYRSLDIRQKFIDACQEDMQVRFVIVIKSIVINCQHTCSRGLRYSVCVSVCLSVTQQRAGLEDNYIQKIETGIKVLPMTF